LPLLSLAICNDKVKSLIFKCVDYFSFCEPAWSGFGGDEFVGSIFGCLFDFSDSIYDFSSYVYLRIRIIQLTTLQVGTR